MGRGGAGRRAALHRLEAQPLRGGPSARARVPARLPLTPHLPAAWLGCSNPSPARGDPITRTGGRNTMSDTANAAGTEGANGAEGAEGTDATPTVEELTAQLEEWKSNARKHEDRAKANKAAAEELAELKRAQMTDAQKAEADRQAATEALTAATKRAEDAEARLTRYRLAVELELSKEDAAALEQIQGDEA